MPLPSIAIPADVRERITAAAAGLFEQSGRQDMPTVDAVRRAARVDMNAASAVMKEWRRAQTAQAAPVVVTVPDAVQEASAAAVASIWLQAQELANESLRNAQAAWEVERGELDAMRQELAEAFERQAIELDTAVAALAAEKATAGKQALELAAVRQLLVDAVSQADKAGARIAEIEHRATDLRAELDRAHADADHLREEASQARKQAAAELEAAHAGTDAARAQLVKLQAQAEAAEQTHAEQRKQTAADAKTAAEARERAAGLAGQLQALQEQNAALLAALKPSAGSKPGKA